MKFLGRKYNNMEEKEKILNGLDKYETFINILNKRYENRRSYK